MSAADAWRERVEDVLWVELGMRRRMRRGQGVTVALLGPGPHELPTGLETIEAFEQIGLLDRHDADIWRARVLAPHVPIAVPDHARRKLHGQLAGLIAEARAHPRDDAAWFRPQHVLNDLVALGVIDDDDRHWWFERLGTRRDPQAGDASPPEPARATLARFVRSVPGPAERRRGVRLLGVDLFEDGVVVHLQLARRGRDADGTMRPLPDEVEPHRGMAPRILLPSLADDLGTAYLGGSGGGGGNGSRRGDGPCVFWWSGTFDTPVPPAASRLTVSCRDLRFEVVL